MNKIVRVTEYDKLQLEELTEVWEVVRVLNRDEAGYMYVLLERNEEQSAERQKAHDEYLDIVSRIDFRRSQ